MNTPRPEIIYVFPCPECGALIEGLFKQVIADPTDGTIMEFKQAEPVVCPNCGFTYEADYYA